MTHAIKVLFTATSIVDWNVGRGRPYFAVSRGYPTGHGPELDRTTVLQHLRVLENASLMTGRKMGRERHLALAPLPIKRIHDRWISDYTRPAVELLDRLDLDGT
jgi:hypothetical protein